MKRALPLWRWEIHTQFFDCCVADTQLDWQQYHSSTRLCRRDPAPVVHTIAVGEELAFLVPLPLQVLTFGPVFQVVVDELYCMPQCLKKEAPLQLHSARYSSVLLLDSNFCLDLVPEISSPIR